MMPDSFDATKLENAAIGQPIDPGVNCHIVDLDNNAVNTNVVARPDREDEPSKGSRDCPTVSHQPNNFSTAAAMRSSMRSWPLRASSMSPTGSAAGSGSEMAQRSKKLPIAVLRSEHEIARGEHLRIRHLRDRGRDDRRGRHDQRIGAGKAPIQRPHQTLARADRLDVVRRRNRTAALDADADIRVDVGCAPLEAVAMNGTSFGRHDAALGVDLGHVVEQRQLVARDAHAGAVERVERRAKGGSDGVVESLERQPLGQTRNAGRRAAAARAVQNPRRP